MRVREAAGRRPIAWLLPALLLGACMPPRPTWVRPDEPAVVEVPRAASQGPAPIPLEAGGGDARRARVHVVREGETLYRIARTHGIDPDRLADLNQIGDVRRLPVGRELVLPGPAPRTPQVAARAAPARLGPPPSGPAPKLRWPVKGVLYSRFGAREDGRHDGIDIAAPEGTPIHAAAGGRVIYAGTQRGYGKIVILRHAGGLVTLYAHNHENLVGEGQGVEAGQPIARVGRTGRATGPHCHFEVREGVAPRDPLSYLPR